MEEVTKFFDLILMPGGNKHLLDCLIILVVGKEGKVEAEGDESRLCILPPIRSQIPPKL